MTTTTTYFGEHFVGSRGSGFRDIIRSILIRSRLRSDKIDDLLNAEGMAIYDEVFTHPSVNEDKNYEFYETIGDSTANNCIVWYLTRRFPQIFCPKGVSTLTLLKNKYVSKSTFFPIAQSLGLWNFISATESVRQTKMKPMLEDVFEAFIGATQLIIDDRFGIGVGHFACYNIIESVFEQIPISLDYKNLVDSKTRLKEITDKFRELNIKTQSNKRQDNLMNVKIFLNNIVIGEATAPLQAAATQEASRKALEELEKRGITKKEPDFYTTFCS
jgi:dsRNA-specific ribonuclease